MGVTDAQVKDLKDARAEADRLHWLGYDAQKWRREDPNTFAGTVERMAGKIRDLIDGVLGGDDG